VVTMVLKVAPLSAADIGIGEHLVQPFLAYTAHIVACIRFAIVQNPEIHAASCKEGGEGLGDFLVTRIEGRVVADEPQHFHRFLARVFDLETAGIAPRPRLRFDSPNELPVL